MIPWEVTKAKALPGYRLEVTFADGLHGVADLSDVPHVGVFAPWADESYFGQARVDVGTGTVCWPGGEDVAPDGLYEEIKGKRERAA